MRLRPLALAVVVFGFWSTPSHANLIVNSNFGTGDFTGCTLFTTAGGTEGTAPGVSSFDVTGGGASNAATFEVGGPGNPTPGGGGLFQNVVTGSGIGTFSAAIAAFSPASENADGGTFSVLLDGVTEATFAVGDIPTGATVRSSLTFIAPVTSGTHEIEILITRVYLSSASTPFEYFTNVSFDAPSEVAVPEPSTLALFGIGLLGIAFMRRRAAA
jgi:hypothetical protein